MSKLNDEGANMDAASELARRGGRARAAKLDPKERSAIAAEAAAARWDVHVAESTGEIQIGKLSIACAVLDDGTRVVSQSTVLQALGRNPEKSRRARGTSELRAPFLLANNLQPFISEQLRALDEPIPYRVAGESGRSLGYRADAAPRVPGLHRRRKGGGA